MQVMGLTALGIAAGMLTSTTTKDEEKSIYRSLEKGEGELRILYVTPEKIAKSKRFVSKLEKCNHAGRLSLVAIDEAHCCSQWGHDFRPDYKNLGILKKQFPKVPMIALTVSCWRTSCVVRILPVACLTSVVLQNIYVFIECAVSPCLGTQDCADTMCTCFRDSLSSDDNSIEVQGVGVQGHGY
jgi:hypothetical protein